MVEITFISSTGEETILDVEQGTNVMQAALSNDVEGITGECGGSMMCATCHCYIDKKFMDRVGEKMDGEDDMLECAASEINENSRLSCQVKITEKLDGLIIHLPEDQI